MRNGKILVVAFAVLLMAVACSNGTTTKPTGSVADEYRTTIVANGQIFLSEDDVFSNTVDLIIGKTTLSWTGDVDGKLAGISTGPINSYASVGVYGSGIWSYLYHNGQKIGHVFRSEGGKDGAEYSIDITTGKTAKGNLSKTNQHPNVDINLDGVPDYPAIDVR